MTISLTRKAQSMNPYKRVPPPSRYGPQKPGQKKGPGTKDPQRIKIGPPIQCPSWGGEQPTGPWPDGMDRIDVPVPNVPNMDIPLPPPPGPSVAKKGPVAKKGRSSLPSVYLTAFTRKRA